jgi:streptogramin lyase
MKQILKTLLAGFILATIAMTCSRPPTSVAGGTDIGNPGTIAGILVDTLGMPQPGILTKLLPVDFNPISDSLGTNPRIDTTDANGRFEFKGLPAGLYTFTSVNTASGSGILIDSIKLSDTQGVNLHTGTMRSTVSLRVTIPDSLYLANSYIYVPGTQLSALVSGPGVVDLGVVPADAARIRYYSATADSVVATEQQLIVTRDTIPFMVATELITSVISGKAPVFTDVSIDSAGGVWCSAGADGAYVFTGTQWSHHNFLDSLNQPLLLCNHVTVTPSNQVWVCDSATACSYDGSIWLLHHFPNRKITDMVSDPAGNVWLAAGDSIFMWVNRTGPDSFAVKFHGYTGMNTIAVQRTGTLWFSCDSGFIKFSGDSGLLVHAALQNALGQAVTGLSPIGIDLNDEVIVASLTGMDGAWRYDGVSWTSIGPANQGFAPNGAVADASGAVWCSTTNGQFRIQAADWQRFPPQGYPATWQGNAVAIDKKGTVWFAGIGGAVAFNESLWTVYTRE